MAIAPVTLDGDVSTLLPGVEFDPRRIQAVLETNVPPGELLVDTSPDGQVFLGAGAVAIAADGTFEIDLLPTDAEALNWGNLQYRLTFTFTDLATRKGGQRATTGWFDITESMNVRDLVERDYLPPTARSQAVAELQGIIDGAVDEVRGEVAADVAAAQAARDLAEQYRDEARDISNIDTTDDAVDAVLNLPGGKAQGTLKTTFVLKGEGGIESAAISNIATTTDENAVPAEGQLLVIYNPFVYDFTDFATDLTGFSQRWNSGSWSVGDDATATDGKALKFPGGSLRRLLSWDVVDTDADRANVEVVARMKQAANGGSFSTGLAVRASGAAGSENAYICGLINGQVYLSQYVDGTYSLRDGVGTAVAADTWFWIRLRAEGNSIMARSWLDTDSEPTTWGTTIAANEHTGPGWVGALGGAWVVNQTWDCMGVAVGGKTAPKVAA